MEFLGEAVPGLMTGDLLTGLAFGILKIVALIATGLVIAGTIASCLCDLFECRKWRRYHGRSLTWQLMH